MVTTSRQAACPRIIFLGAGLGLAILAGCTAPSSAFATAESGPMSEGSGSVYLMDSAEALLVMQDAMSANFRKHRIRCMGDHPDGIWIHHCSATAYFVYIEVNWSVSAIAMQGERPDGTLVAGIGFLVSRHENASVATMESLAEDLADRAGRLALFRPVARQ